MAQTFLYLLAFLALRFLFHYDESEPILFLIAITVLLTLLMSALVIPKSFILHHVAIFLFCSPDITQDNLMVEEFGHLKAASIWQLSVIGEPSVTWLLVLFGIYFWRLRFLRFNGIIVLAFMFFIALPLCTSMLYGYMGNLSNVVADLKFGIGLCLGLVFFNSPAIREQFQDRSFQFLLLGGSFSVLVFDFFIMSNRLMAGLDYKFVNLSMDVAKVFTLFCCFYAIGRIRSSPFNLFWWVVVFVSVTLVFEYQTRWLLLCLVGGFFLLLRSAFWIAIVMGLISVNIVYAVYDLGYEPVVLMLNRFNLGTGFDLSTIDGARFVALTNVVHLLNNSYAWIFGLGAGSYFTDFPVSLQGLTTASYSVDSLAAGRYYRTHDFFSHSVFKFGLAGVLAYWVLVHKSLLSNIRSRRGVDPAAASICEALVAMYPVVLTFLYYSTKGIILAAFILAAHSSFATTSVGAWKRGNT